MHTCGAASQTSQKFSAKNVTARQQGFSYFLKMLRESVFPKDLPDFQQDQ